jgi:hypothetical protein
VNLVNMKRQANPRFGVQPQELLTNPVVTEPNNIPLGNRSARANRPYLPLNERQCYACQQYGHIARDCTSLEVDNKVNPQPQAVANLTFSTEVWTANGKRPMTSTTVSSV